MKFLLSVLIRCCFSLASIPIAMLRRLWLSRRGAETHGSAKFAVSRDVRKAGMMGSRGFLLGKMGSRFIRCAQPGHQIVFAPTRSGKGVGLAVPNLLEHPGSTVVHDTKGELFAITAKRRSQISDVHVLAPFEDWSSSFNPLDFIRLGTPYEVDDAKALARLLFTPGSKGDRHWEEEGLTLMAALLLYVLHHRPWNQHHMAELRAIVTAGAEQFEKLIDGMCNSPHIIISSAGNNLMQKIEKERLYILSEVTRQTAIWDNPCVQRISKHSDFNFEDLKQKNISVYVHVPPEYVNTYTSFLRAILGVATSCMTRNKVRPQSPVLFMLDEFPILGRMDCVESAIGIMAGYGASFHLYVQNLQQLSDVYDSWETFVANCHVRQAFGVQDISTARMLSEMLGNETIRVRSHSIGGGQGDLMLSNVNESLSDTSRNLLGPDEILNMRSDQQLIFMNGLRPVMAGKIKYFEERCWRGLWGSWEHAAA